VKFPPLIRKLATPVTNRSPVSGLEPSRLYLYFDALHERRQLDGSVLEIGCHRCGTAAIAYRFLEQIGSPRRYVCVDTFGGFESQQFSHDEAGGVSSRHRSTFSDNSLRLASYLIKRYGTPEIQLVQADISTIAADELPDEIVVCLLDVDLEIPIIDGLNKVLPRLVDGGIILVDDCGDETVWAGARKGYVQWCTDNGHEPRFDYGFGIVEKHAASSPQ